MGVLYMSTYLRHSSAVSVSHKEKGKRCDMAWVVVEPLSALTTTTAGVGFAGYRYWKQAKLLLEKKLCGVQYPSRFRHSCGELLVSAAAVANTWKRDSYFTAVVDDIVKVRFLKHSHLALPEVRWQLVEHDWLSQLSGELSIRNINREYNASSVYALPVEQCKCRLQMYVLIKMQLGSPIALASNNTARC